MTEFAVYRAADVRARLDFPGCIDAVRGAMAALSDDARPQPLRSINPVADKGLFALMPGWVSGDSGFGAKIISVYPQSDHPGRSGHQGVVVLFDEDSGSVECVADAHEVTRVRTACASAVATDLLARQDASTLAVFGCGTQAAAHIEAIPLVRPIDRVMVWGRNAETTRQFVERTRQSCALDIVAMADPAAMAGDADIICTTTGAAEPILFRDWIRAGTHINAVGSSHAGPVEIDPVLVAASEFYVDYRASALVAAAEYLRALEEGLVGESHIRAEIGEVVNGSVPGRVDDETITIYKSLGHIVQDLAAARYVHATRPDAA